MTRIVHVARREFLSTVLTKGFIIGILLTPCLVAVTLVLMPALLSEAAPPIVGEVLVSDPIGLVYPGVRDYLGPAALARKRAELLDDAAEVMPIRVGEAAVQSVLGEVPKLDVILHDGDVNGLKPFLLAVSGPLAIAVIPDDAVDGARGSYQLFIREKLDDRLERDELDALIRVPYSRSTTVTKDGERDTFELLNTLLPLVFMALVLMSVLVSGQYLMTTTIEEKQSRVVEMLLAAVSPMELMTGKIVGQLGVGLLVLSLYSGAGIVGLLAFSLAGAIDIGLVVYMLISYLIAYFVIASLMAAIGAAVNELREAQTLMTPLALVMMVPWLLWLPISRNRFHARRGDELSAAGQHVCDAAALDEQLTASVLASSTVTRDRRRVGLRGALVRGQDLSHRPFDARKTTEPPHPHPLGPHRLSERCGMLALG